MVDKGRRCESGQGCHCYKRQLVVGCALLPKKVSRYLTPKMMSTAAMHNIQIVQIDYTRSLLTQGPFDVIVHKLRPNPAWEQFLYEYKAAHPEVCIIDRLDRIKALHNRATMLTPLKGDGISLSQPLASHERQHQQPQLVRVQAPLQVEIREGATEADAQAALAAAGLSPPLLCKPLWTDGREGSHGLAVLHDLEELGRLLHGGVSNEFKPPLVVQQFVEHGGVLFKVYVLGSQTVVTARPSLGEQALEAEQGVQQLPRISCVSVFGKQLQRQQQQQQCGRDACCQSQQQPAGTAALAPGSPGGLAAVAAAWRPPPTAAACPPEWVTAGLAATLRQELGMQLFNFDLIVPEQQEREQDGDAPPLCYVVDINYFPGVDKIANFEQRFVALLREVAEEHEQRQQHKRQRQQQQQQLASNAAAGSMTDTVAVVTPPPPQELDGSSGNTAKQLVAATQQQEQQTLLPVAAAGASAVQQQQGAGPTRQSSWSRHSYSGSDSSAGANRGSALVGCSSGGFAELHIGGSCSPSHRRHHSHHRHARRSHEGFGVDVGGGSCVGVMGSSPPLLEV